MSGGARADRRRSIALHNFPELGHRAAQMSLPEKGRAADKGVRARVGTIGRRFKIHTAIDPNVVREASLLPPGVRLLDLRQRLINKWLSAKTGVYGHDQQRINLIQKRLRMRNRSRRI